MRRVVAVIVLAVAILASPAGANAQNLLQRLGAALNPLKAVDTVKTNYRDHRFYATDYTEHSSIRGAINRSIRPVDIRTNVKAAFRGNLHPLSLLGNLVAPMGMEIQKQVYEDGKIDPIKLVKRLEPGALIGGTAGGLVGDMAGAAVQSTLSRVGGPFGPVLGFVARPLVSYAGFLVGSNFGRTCAEGKPSLKNAFADSIRSTDPMRDAGALIGGSVGSVIGQALIPIPVVGGIIGSLAGGVVGSMIGNFLGHHGPTGDLNEAAQRWMKEKADQMDSRTNGADAAAAAEAGTAETTNDVTAEVDGTDGTGPADAAETS